MSKKNIFEKAVRATLENTNAQIQYGAETAVRHIGLLDHWMEVHAFAHSVDPEYDCRDTGGHVVGGIKAEAESLEGLTRVGYAQVMQVHAAAKALDKAAIGETLGHMPEGMRFIAVEDDGTHSPEDLLARAKQAMQDEVDLNAMHGADSIPDPHDPAESAASAGNNPVSETPPTPPTEHDPNGEDNQ